MPLAHYTVEPKTYGKNSHGAALGHMFQTNSSSWAGVQNVALHNLNP